MTMYSETNTIYDVAKTKLITDAQLDQAKATLFRFAGIGLLTATLGAGIGMACFGYSYVTDGRAQARKMADAIVQALNTAKPSVTGEVKLADGSVVKLAPGGQVGIAPGSVVRVDTSSTGSSAGLGTWTGHPPASVPPIETSPLPQNKVITQYTIFKTVSFDAGRVVSGWVYDNSNQTSPTHQYCYYIESVSDKAEVKTDLGKNGVMLDDLALRAGVDPTTAFNSCVWFSGGL